MMNAADVTIVRIFDAPRPLVWSAFTDPAQLARWWGPRGYTTPVCEFEARVGAALRLEMADPDGVRVATIGEVQEVAEPERLAFSTHAFHDEAGEPQLEGYVTVTFADHGDKTEVTVHSVLTKLGPGLEDAGAGMEQGWRESLDKLAEDLRDTVLKMRHDS
jgi:uncharacterized protein YndB with AHSA1/START domain